MVLGRREPKLSKQNRDKSQKLLEDIGVAHAELRSLRLAYGPEKMPSAALVQRWERKLDNIGSRVDRWSEHRVSDLPEGAKRDEEHRRAFRALTDDATGFVA